MSEGPNVKPMAIGLCVSDADRSIEFYTKALGFRVALERTESSDRSPILELDNVTFREIFLVLDHLMMTMFWFDRPPAAAESGHALNRIGLTQLTLAVPDIDEAAARIAAYGGTPLAHTRTIDPRAIMLAVTDPDGIHIHLVQRTD